MQAKAQRFYSLDGLKAIAMLLIFWWHCSIPNPQIDLGARCCEFLFVASGFLIGHKYAEMSYGQSRMKQAVRAFFQKLCSIYPLYLIALIGLIAFGLLTHRGGVKDNANLFVNILLIQSWNSLNLHFTSVNGPTWFLSALLPCYFISPFIAHYLKQRRESNIAVGLVFAVRILLEWRKR